MHLALERRTAWERSLSYLELIASWSRAITRSTGTIESHDKQGESHKKNIRDKGKTHAETNTWDEHVRQKLDESKYHMHSFVCAVCLLQYSLLLCLLRTALFSFLLNLVFCSYLVAFCFLDSVGRLWPRYIAGSSSFSKQKNSMTSKWKKWSIQTQSMCIN